jgi:hypothetical protein
VLLTCEGEYEFGRFGCGGDGDSSEAHSFLYFRSSTVFTQTHFRGRRKPLRELLSDHQRYERRLARGDRFDGFDVFRQIIDKVVCTPVQQHQHLAHVVGTYI